MKIYKIFRVKVIFSTLPYGNIGSGGCWNIGGHEDMSSHFEDFPFSILKIGQNLMSLRKNCVCLVWLRSRAMQRIDFLV